jgi:hypothetical protein
MDLLADGSSRIGRLQSGGDARPRQPRQPRQPATQSHPCEARHGAGGKPGCPSGGTRAALAPATEEGAALDARTERVLSEIAEAGEAIRTGTSRPRGRLRISAPVLLRPPPGGEVSRGHSLDFVNLQACNESFRLLLCNHISIALIQDVI